MVAGRTPTRAVRQSNRLASSARLTRVAASTRIGRTHRARCTGRADGAERGSQREPTRSSATAVPPTGKRLRSDGLRFAVGRPCPHAATRFKQGQLIAEDGIFADHSRGILVPLIDLSGNHWLDARGQAIDSCSRSTLWEKQTTRYLSSGRASTATVRSPYFFATARRSLVPPGPSGSRSSLNSPMRVCLVAPVASVLKIIQRLLRSQML